MTAAIARAPLGVLGPVDEAEQVALVEELEAVHLIDDGRDAGQPVGHLPREFEADVQMPRAQVEQQVTGRRHGRMPRALELDEGVQVRGARRGIRAVPQVGTDADDAVEPVGRHAEGAPIASKPSYRPPSAGRLGPSEGRSVYLDTERNGALARGRLSEEIR